jgi:tRNA pseudouridine32 synthase / 23S rRNA pseudouridine746 synthase
MVFARNEEAAASLCKDWRERQVTKEYVAMVRHWPPFHDNQLVEGTITVALAPSEERLKWKVVSSDNHEGKPSTTLWKVLPQARSETGAVDKLADELSPPSTSSGTTTSMPPNANYFSVVLALVPVTGRTHQLRIHCAHVGSGILGDDLYGTAASDPDRRGCLYLHARRLEFSHPQTNAKCTYCSTPDWLDGGRVVLFHDLQTSP